jgi:hypothetical protein
MDCLIFGRYEYEHCFSLMNISKENSRHRQFDCPCTCVSKIWSNVAKKTPKINIFFVYVEKCNIHFGKYFYTCTCDIFRMSV